jgi:hypothetical protein
MEAGRMGRNNRNKMLRMVMPKLKAKFGHLCPIGGFGAGEPVKMTDAELLAFSMEAMQ